LKARDFCKAAQPAPMVPHCGLLSYGCVPESVTVFAQWTPVPPGGDSVYASRTGRPSPGEPRRKDLRVWDLSPATLSSFSFIWRIQRSFQWKPSRALAPARVSRQLPASAWTPKALQRLAPST
jgi:hypothetical protein